MKELKAKTSNYTAFVVGSDQLWFPSNVAAGYFTLEFVPNDIPKISLSTSFGVARIRESQKKHTASFLKRLNYISVREESGQQIVKDLTGRDVPVTADPTLLLTVDEWSGMQKQERIIAEKYIFCYFLGNNPEHRAFAKRMRAKTGMKIVQLQHLYSYIPEDHHFPDCAPYNISPLDFISLIRDAEYVLTDSFHGTVFSLLYRKSFFCFRRYRESSTVSTNNRLYSLLSRVGMESRLLCGDEPIDDCLKITSDFESVHAVISEWRASTFDYLTRALDESGIGYDKYYE
jgi:hypothetical protein